MNRFATRSVVTALSLAMLLAGCKGDEAEAPPAQATVAAETLVLVPQSFAETVDGVGSVVPRTDGLVTLGAPVAARIARVRVVVGQRVARGDVLVELDRTSIDAEAQSAEAALTAAEAAAARATRLLEAGVMPRRDAEQATAAAARARADAATARRNATLATLRAPIAGVVTRVTAVAGALADPAAAMVEIANPAALDVVISASADNAERLRPGLRVTLHAGADSLGVGHVVDVGSAVDSLSRGVMVRVQVEHSVRPLRLGESLSAHLLLATAPNAIVVPIAALVPAAEGFQVFVVDSANVAHPRAVTIGGKDAVHAHVISGLAAGERIVTQGAYGMDEGAKVVAPGAPK
ncbi:MAG: efflux RND transporter periplasmic adaptor subunit [Gemmatimonadota bacterium]